MKKTAIVLSCLLVASAASADVKVDGGPIVITGAGALVCDGAPDMTCGDSMTGVVGGGLGNVTNYGCTTLSYADSDESVYAICVADATTLTVDMTYAHGAANDLDLFLLGSCNEADCLDSSTATSGAEQVSAAVGAGTYYVVVDGWNGLSDGSGHVITVTCDAPCDPVSVEAESWGSVKALYNE